MLGGRPSEAGAALQDQRLKQKIVRGVKREEYPAGLGIEGPWFNYFISLPDANSSRNLGAFKLFWDDMKKPVNEKYIHRLVTMPDGEQFCFNKCFIGSILSRRHHDPYVLGRPHEAPR